MSTIKELQEAIGKWSREKGWWDDNESSDLKVIATKLALVHSEVSEALEELRENSYNSVRFIDEKPEGFVIELADVVIRILDLCEALNLDLGTALQIKMEYNYKRPYKHGGKSI